MRENEWIVLVPGSPGGWRDNDVFLHFFDSVEIIVFSQKDPAPSDGGDSACPPKTPLRFAMMSYYLHGFYRAMGDVTEAGVEA